MNCVLLCGRLTRDPEVRYTQGAEPMAIARFTLAVNRMKKKGEEQQADFISCVLFGKIAQSAEMYLHKGIKINLRGHIQTGNYTKNDGTKVYTTDVVVDEWEFAESKSATQDEATRRQQESGLSSDGFMQIPDGIEDELPFN